MKRLRKNVSEGTFALAAVRRTLIAPAYMNTLNATLSYLSKSNGLRPETAFMKKKNKILKLWKSGMSKRAIGLKVGVHRSYVQKVIKLEANETLHAKLS